MIPKDYFDAFKARYKSMDKKAIKDELDGKDGTYANWNRLHTEVAWAWW